MNMDTNEAGVYLRHHGWFEDERWPGPMRWRDPMNLASWYTFEDAVAVQRQRSGRGRT